MVYNGYYKVMSNSPKMGHLPIPAIKAKSSEAKRQKPSDQVGMQMGDVSSKMQHFFGSKMQKIARETASD